jgi:cytochrome c peroxidase
MKISLILFISILGSTAKSESIDDYLRKKIELFKLKPIQKISKNPNIAQVELGRRLFIEPNLSGNKNINCMTCHHPRTGTSDLRPLSRTEDGRNILRRNSQAIFNLKDKSFMFWDGRVHYDSKAKTFSTPGTPLPPSITNVLTSSLAAQALFPIVSSEEMKGKPGENEIANAQNNFEAWQRVVERLMNEQKKNPRHKTYSELFAQAYPKTKLEDINIGHVGEAIAAFEIEEFQSSDTPYFRYLNGDRSALSEQEKRGLIVFVESGKCITCHNGPDLGNNELFTSVAVPQWGAKPISPDKGRGEITHDFLKNYFFRTPSLINIDLTAPYMHNGAFANLSEVINHYNNIEASLKNYVISGDVEINLPVDVEVNRDPKHLKEVLNSIEFPFLRYGLNLSEKEKKDLEAFLNNALSDPRWKSSIQ